jgi:hypothetical protein
VKIGRSIQIILLMLVSAFSSKAFSDEYACANSNFAGTERYVYSRDAMATLDRKFALQDFSTYYKKSAGLSVYKATRNAWELTASSVGLGLGVEAGLKLFGVAAPLVEAGTLSSRLLPAAETVGNIAVTSEVVHWTSKHLDDGTVNVSDLNPIIASVIAGQVSRTRSSGMISLTPELIYARLATFSEARNAIESRYEEAENSISDSFHLLGYGDTQAQFYELKKQEAIAKKQLDDLELIYLKTTIKDLQDVCSRQASLANALSADAVRKNVSPTILPVQDSEIRGASPAK